MGDSVAEEVCELEAANSGAIRVSRELATIELGEEPAIAKTSLTSDGKMSN